MKRPKAKKCVMKYADGGQVKKIPVPRVKPIERAAKGWDSNKDKLPHWNSYTHEPFIKGKATPAEKKKLMERLDKASEKKYPEVKKDPKSVDPGLEKYKELERDRSEYNTGVYNSGVAANEKSKPNLKKAKDKVKHYAKGGLVKGFMSKRYEEAHNAPKKNVPIPRVKPKSKP